MWHLLLELIPELYGFFKEQKIRKNYLTIMLFVFSVILIFCIYHDFYQKLSLIILVLIVLSSFIFFIFYHKKIVLRQKKLPTLILSEDIYDFQERRYVDYAQIVSSFHMIKYGENNIVISISALSGGTHLFFDKKKIESMPLSPIFDYGKIFSRNIMDKNKRLFSIEVKLKGYFKPYVLLEIKKLN